MVETPSSLRNCAALPASPLALGLASPAAAQEAGDVDWTGA